MALIVIVIDNDEGPIIVILINDFPKLRLPITAFDAYLWTQCLEQVNVA